MAQTPVYVDPSPVYTTAGNSNIPSFPNATVNVCNYPSVGLPCTNLAATYSAAYTSFVCPSNAQLISSSSSACTSKTDALGNFSFWALPGVYAYTVTTSLGNFGPYLITAGTSPNTAGPVVYATSFGIVCDGITVNKSSSFVALNAFLVANDNTTVVFPSNATCMLSGLGVNPLVGPDWLTGVSRATLIGNQTAIINQQIDSANNNNFAAGGSSFVCLSGPITNPTLNYDYTASPIQTVAAQSSTLTVTNPQSVANWQPGDSLLVYGFDQQGSGFPPNYRYFEHKKLLAVSGSTLTLDSPLVFGYNANWYYSTAAGSTPPSVRNLSRPCNGGGSVQRMKRLSVQGFDFSQTIPSQRNQIPTTYASGVDYVEFINDVFGYFAPTDVGTVTVRNSTFQWIEMDKLVNSFQCVNCVVSGNQQSPGGAGVTSGSGTLYSEFDNSTFFTPIDAYPRNFVLNNDTFYGRASSPWGFLQNQNGYAVSATYNNPRFVANGVKENGVYNVAGGYTITVTSVPNSTTFTVASSDVARTINLAGTGTQVKDHKTGAVVGVVSDVYLNSGVLTVSGVWSVPLTVGEVVELNPNPISVSVLNPVAVDFDINTIPPAFDSTPNASIANLTMQFPQLTTVHNLGPCNTASTSATKWVNDAAGPSALGAGGGQTTIQVACQGTGEFGGNYAPVTSHP